MWRPVVGYEGLYEVSNKGRVKNSKTGKILKPYSTGHKYLHVRLTKNGVDKNHKIHRLVAMAFIPNPNNLPCVNHKDCYRTNNVVENLEWCSYSYNNNYKDANERRSKTLTNGVTSKPVLQYDGTMLIRKWPSLSEVERSLGFSHGNISSCCSGKQKTAYGFVWRYAVSN